MRYYAKEVTLTEIPGEISVSFSITGCPLRCKGCHTPQLRDENVGDILTEEFYTSIIKKYKGIATCVLFFGGEWHFYELIHYLNIARNLGYKTALYTGRTSIDDQILHNLDYVKYGPYVEKLGGLANPNTNQKLIKLFPYENITYKFWESKGVR